MKIGKNENKIYLCDLVDENFSGDVLDSNFYIAGYIMINQFKIEDLSVEKDCILLVYDYDYNTYRGEGIELIYRDWSD